MKENDVGVFHGIPNESYHRGRGVSKSGLDLIRRSPAHYRYAMDAANDDEGEETRWQRIGSLTHKLILEPEAIWNEYAEPFQASENAIHTVDQAKECLRALGLPVGGKRDELLQRLRDADPMIAIADDERAHWDAQRGDRRVINASELELAEAMREAVEAHPIASALFLSSPGEPELSCYWFPRPDRPDVIARCRPDWWRLDGVLVDLKTTQDASPEAFQRSVLDYRYHVQAALYLDGVRAAMQQHEGELPPDLRAPTDFVIIAVEKKPPHAVAVYRIADEAIDIGRREYQRDIDTYAECLRTGRWPGYGDRVHGLTLPDWFMIREQRGAV